MSVLGIGVSARPHALFQAGGVWGLPFCRRSLLPQCMLAAHLVRGIMPAPPSINGLKKTYNRALLFRLRSHFARLASTVRANNKLTDKVQPFFMCFILQNELSTALLNACPENILRQKLTQSAILSAWLCCNDINM